MATLDWRGQGGSARLLREAWRGHIRSFRHYDIDLETFVREIVLPDCPPPYYAIGHSTFDQPGYEKSTDGMVARVVIQGKQIRRVSIVPVTRDGNNDVYLLDPSAGEGAKLVQWVKERSANPPPMRIDGHEVVLFDKAARATNDR